MRLRRAMVVGALGVAVAWSCERAAVVGAIAAADAATLRIQGLPTGCKPVSRGGDYVVQCPDPKKPGAWRDRVFIPASVVCPKPPRTDTRTTDGGLFANCNR